MTRYYEFYYWGDLCFLRINGENSEAMINYEFGKYDWIGVDGDFILRSVPCYDTTGEEINNKIMLRELKK